MFRVTKSVFVEEENASRRRGKSNYFYSHQKETSSWPSLSPVKSSFHSTVRSSRRRFIRLWHTRHRHRHRRCNSFRVIFTSTIKSKARVDTRSKVQPVDYFWIDKKKCPNFFSPPEAVVPAYKIHLPYRYKVKVARVLAENPFQLNVRTHFFIHSQSTFFSIFFLHLNSSPPGQRCFCPSHIHWPGLSCLLLPQKHSFSLSSPFVTHLTLTKASATVPPFIEPFFTDPNFT